MLEGTPQGLQIRCHPDPSYTAGAPQTAEWRSRIVRYFSDLEPFPTDLDFDRKRSTAVPNQRLHPTAAGRHLPALPPLPRGRRG
jgi:hypothetical protein